MRRGRAARTMARAIASGIACLVLPFACWGADAWEPADNGISTPNELFTGSPPQLHDLQSTVGGADQDWYWIRVGSGRSYEVQVLGFSSAAPTVTRLDSNGTLLLQTADSLDGGFSRTLRWISSSSGSEYIRVAGTVGVGAESQYVIQYRETTLFCPRYNNSGTQVSVLIMQRSSIDFATTCSAQATFTNETGAAMGLLAATLGVDQMSVTGLSGVAGLAGTRGSARIAHTCGIGGVKAKLVALEPATGFSFDTICSERDR